MAIRVRSCPHRLRGRGPSHASGSTTVVKPVGDDLLVAMSGRIGDPVTIVRDIAEVISEKG